MPLVRSLISKRCTKLVSIIISFGEIMPSYLCCVKRKLLYVVIAALFSYQPSFYTKCTWANMRAFYNIYLVFNIKYVFSPRLISC